ncbi:MAG: hypothetical protein ABEI77_10050 [Halorientalis sp.]
MVTQAPHVDPTHVLVLGQFDDTDPDHGALVSCHTAVLAALDHATAVDVFLDADQIAGVALGSIADIGESFELVADGQYRGELPDDAALLAQLLDVRRFEAIAAIEAIVLRCENTPLLVYRPADRSVELDDRRTDAPADIQSELADAPVGLLRTEPLVQWRADGHEYALAPPSVTVDDAAFDLSNLVSVSFDCDTHRIYLAWDASDTGFLGRLAAHVGPSRPTTLSFPNSAAFERVAQAFERVADTLGVLAGDGSNR